MNHNKLHEFVANTSHRMRTPITIIKESVDILLDEIPGRLNEKQKKVLNMCKSNIARLISDMNGILEEIEREVWKK